MRSQSLSGLCVSRARLPNSHTSSGWRTSRMLSITPSGSPAGAMASILLVIAGTNNRASARAQRCQAQTHHSPTFSLVRRQRRDARIA